MAEIRIRTDADRAKALQMLRDAPLGVWFRLRKNTRSIDQNSRLWAMLTDLSQQLVWHGEQLSPEDWKLVMMDGLQRESRLVPSIDGRGFVQIGFRSSQLTVAEMADLQTLIEAFGAQHGVQFRDSPPPREDDGRAAA